MDKFKSFSRIFFDSVMLVLFFGLIVLYALIGGTWKLILAWKEAAKETAVPLAEMSVSALRKIIKTEDVETRANTAPGLARAIEARRLKNTEQAQAGTVPASAKNGWSEHVKESWSQAVATPGKIRRGIWDFLVLIFEYRKSDSVPFVVFWVLVTFWVARGFVGNPFALDAWIELGKNPWDIAGMVLGFVGIFALTAYAFRKVVEISESWRRAALVASWVIAIAMILATFLYYVISVAIEDDLNAPPAMQQTVVEQTSEVTVTIIPAPPAPTPTVVPRVAQSSDKPGTTNVVPSETRVFGGDYHVKLNGRNPNGTQVVMVNPGQSMRVTHVEGAVSAWDPTTQESREYLLSGLSDGYEYSNTLTRTTWNWIAHYRYGDLAHDGVMPQEVLVVLGDVGSGNEDIFQFPDGTNSVVVKNKAGTPQILTLYYHGMDYYYLGNSGNCLDQRGPYVYPSINAASCSSVAVKRVNGWDDQGLDGSVARFVVETLN